MDAKKVQILLKKTLNILYLYFNQRGWDMRNIFIFVSIFMAFLTPVYAFPLEISISPEHAVTKPFHSVKYLLTITNKQSINDSFLISVTGENVFWRIPGIILKKVPANSSETVDLVFYPTDGYKGIFEYEVIVSSIKNPEIKVSKNISLEIPPELEVKNISAELKGKTLFLDVWIYSMWKKNLKMDIFVKDGFGNIITSDAVVETIYEDQRISKEIVLPENLLAGEYKVEVKMDNISVSQKFQISPVRKVIEKKEEVANPWYREIRITVRNEGNTPEKNYRVVSSVPIDFITGLLTSSESNCYDRGGKRICEHVIEEIYPGETKEIVYRISYLPTYTSYGILLLISLGLIAFFFFKSVSPKIKKKYIKKSENRYTVILEIKNPFYHTLKDVIVKDFVSPLARVSEDIKAVKPVIKKSSKGTELVWRLGAMRPREERILSYNVNTLIQGSLKMPAATARLITRSGKKFLVSSKPLVLE